MSVHIEELVAALRAQGHEVLVVGPTSAEGNQAGKLESLLDRVRQVLPGAVFELLEFAYNIPAYLKLRRAYRSFKPDFLYERYNLYLRAGLWLKRRYKVPMILEVNSPLAQERIKQGGLAFRRLAQHFEESIWGEADAVLPVTNVLADIIARTRQTRDGIFVIPNGVDLARFGAIVARDLAKHRLGLDQSVVLGFTGFIRPWHGLEWAIEALSSLPRNVHLLVVGDGPAREALETQAREAQVSERVHFVGRVDHTQITAYMNAFDIALQPRAVAYASPLKLFEYMALALPVIAPDQPNIREILKHNETALLFDPASKQAFMDCINSLCSDPALGPRLGKAARVAIETIPYTWQHNAARVAEIGAGLQAKRTQPAE